MQKYRERFGSCEGEITREKMGKVIERKRGRLAEANIRLETYRRVSHIYWCLLEATVAIVVFNWRWSHFFRGYRYCGVNHKASKTDGDNGCYEQSIRYVHWLLQVCLRDEERKKERKEDMQNSYKSYVLPLSWSPRVYIVATIL